MDYMLYNNIYCLLYKVSLTGHHFIQSLHGLLVLSHLLGFAQRGWAPMQAPIQRRRCRGADTGIPSRPPSRSSCGCHGRPRTLGKVSLARGDPCLPLFILSLSVSPAKVRMLGVSFGYFHPGRVTATVWVIGKKY